MVNWYSNMHIGKLEDKVAACRAWGNIKIWQTSKKAWMSLYLLAFTVLKTKIDVFEEYLLNYVNIILNPDINKIKLFLIFKKPYF